MYRYDLFVSLGQSYCIFIKYIHVYQTHQSKIEKFAHYFVLYAKFNLFDRTFNFSYFSDTQIFIDISHKKKMYKQCTHIGILNWSSSGDPHALKFSSAEVQLKFPLRLYWKEIHVTPCTKNSIGRIHFLSLTS